MTSLVDAGGLSLLVREAAVHLGLCTLALRASSTAVAAHHVKAALRCLHLIEADLLAQRQRRGGRDDD